MTELEIEKLQETEGEGEERDAVALDSVVAGEPDAELARDASDPLGPDAPDPIDAAVDSGAASEKANEMAAVFEAILFTATEPVPRERLLAVFRPSEMAAAQAALETVLERHRRADDRGIMLEEVAGGLRLATRPELHSWLRRFYEAAGANKLSMAALETLAIVAYRQPVTGPEIQDLRSVSASGVLKTLLERRLIRIAGRKPVVGKPFLYATTREFLMHFGLRDLEDLPPLDEFEETFGEGGEGGGERGSLFSAVFARAGGSATSADTTAAAETGGDGMDDTDREESIRREVAALEELEADAETDGADSYRAERGDLQ